MKNTINKFLFFLSLFVFLSSCDDEELVTLNPDANTVLSLSQTTLVLEEDNALSDALVLTWTDPDFGFDAAPSYSIQLDFSGGDFSSPQIFPAGADLQKTLTVEELNAKLLSLGVAANVATDIDFRIRTVLSPSQEMISDVRTLTVTAYSSLLDLSTNLGVVGSATPGGWGGGDILDLPFYTTSVPDEYVAYVTLRDGEIKFRKDNLWTENYGDDGADGTLEQNGANIAVTAGTYKIVVNLVAGTYTMEEYSWGLVGSATPNGWGGPDFKMQYNSYQDNWKAAVTLIDGEMKFRFNDDWGLNYGDDGADGSLEQNGGNIAVSAGHYIVTLDLNNLEYEIEAVDVWGLVGSATPNGWNGPDTKFIPDFGVNEGVYYINGVTLVGGEIKVRQNDAWGVNYGDDGGDGVMELNGANIPASAGTYNVIFDFSGASPTLTLHAWQ